MEKQEVCPKCGSLWWRNSVKGGDFFNCCSFTDKKGRFDQSDICKDAQLATQQDRIIETENLLHECCKSNGRQQARIEALEGELAQCRDRLAAYKEYMIASESGWTMEKHKAKHKLRSLGEL